MSLVFHQSKIKIKLMFTYTSAESPNSPSRRHAHEVDPAELDTDHVISSLIGAEGNLPLVAEQLFGNTLTDAESLILRAVASNPGALKQYAAQARAVLITKILFMINQLQIQLLAAMSAGTLEPATMSRLMSNMISSMESLTRNDAAPSTDAPAEIVLQSLPANVRQAIRVLQTPPLNGAATLNGAASRN